MRPKLFCREIVNPGLLVRNSRQIVCIHLMVNILQLKPHPYPFAPIRAESC